MLKRAEPRSNSWQASIAQSLEEVELIRDIWQQMESCRPVAAINANIDRYISFLRDGQNGMRPYVITLSREGHPQAMLIGRIENKPLGCRIGYKTLFSLSLRCLTILHGGYFGECTAEVCEAVVNELMNALQRGEAEVAFLSRLDIDSCLYEAARRMPSVLCRGHFPKVESHWAMSVQPDIEEFYQSLSKKHRYNLKRTVKIFEKEYQGRFRIFSYWGQDQIGELLIAASRISVKTYQHTLGCGIIDNQQTRTILETAAANGWLRGHVLFVEAEPVAFQIGTQYKGTYLLENMGYNPAWKRLNVGTVLFLKVLEDICRDGSINLVDLGFGHAKYKEQFGNIRRERVSVYIFAPRLYPLCLNALHSLSAAVSLPMSRLMEQSGMGSRIKRVWRKALTDKNRRD